MNFNRNTFYEVNNDIWVNIESILGTATSFWHSLFTENREKMGRYCNELLFIDRIQWYQDVYAENNFTVRRRDNDLRNERNKFFGHLFLYSFLGIDEIINPTEINQRKLSSIIPEAVLIQIKNACHNIL